MAEYLDKEATGDLAEEAKLSKEEALDWRSNLSSLRDGAISQLMEVAEGDDRDLLIHEWKNRHGASDAIREFNAARAERARLLGVAPEDGVKQTGEGNGTHDPLAEAGNVSPLEALSLGFMTLCQQYQEMGKQLEWMSAAITVMRQEAGIHEAPRVVIATEVPPSPHHRKPKHRR